jgi:fructose-bisphosphate aldolase, class II
MIVTTKALFEVAYGKFAVGAYNINNMEQTLGLFRGNLESKAPFIIQISRGARSYADKRMLEAMIRAADEIFPEAIFAVHLDHGDLATALDCVESGFYSSVMIDASQESLEENIRITRQVVDAAHARGMSVEAELGRLGGVEEHVQVEEKDAHLTDPAEAEVFVRESGCDSLAVAIGTSHGAYKFTKPPTGAVLRIDRIKEIHARIPNTHLVMHGSSSVPQEWLEVINKFGGNMGETYGVPVEEIVEGIKHGVRKVNIDTDLRMASTGAIRKFLVEDTKNFDPRKFLAASTKAMKEICKARYEAFGCAGQAAKIKPVALDNMASRYSKGELDAVIK